MDAVAGILNKIIIAAPFVVVTTLGLHVDSKASEFRYVAYSKIENERVTDYIPLVRATDRAFRSSDVIPAKTATLLADQWIGGYRSGRLANLTPIAMDETSQDGVKFVIVRDCSLIAESLAHSAQMEARQKNYSAACRDAIKSAVLIQSVKGFDFPSLAVSSMIVRRAVELTSSWLPKLTDEERLADKEVVKSLITQTDLVKKMTLTEREFVIQREGLAPGKESFVDLVDKFMSKPTSSKSVYIDTSSNLIPSTDCDDDVLVDMVNEYRLGCSSASETNRSIEQLQNVG
jgi:hypothetical protein